MEKRLILGVEQKMYKMNVVHLIRQRVRPYAETTTVIAKGLEPT